MYTTNTHKCKLSRTKGGFRPLPTLSYSESCKNWIRSATTISKRNPLTKFAFRSVKSIEDEKKRHINSKYWYVIHPYSMFSHYWMIIMMVVFIIAQPCDYMNNLYYIIDTDIPKLYFYTLLTVDFFHIIHIFVTFMTGFHKLKTEQQLSLKGIDKFEISIITLEPKEIAKRYLKSYFIVDIPCVICLPLLYEEYFRRESYFLSAIIQSPRIFRMITVIRSFHTLFLNFRESDVIVKILKYIIWVWIILLFFGCYQLIISNTIEMWTNSPRDTFSKQIKQIYEERGLEEPSVTLYLIHSISELAQDFASPIIRIPKNLIEEKIFFVTVCLIGIIGKLYMFVGIFSILDQKHLLDQKYKLFIQEMKLFLKSLDVLQPLYGEAEDYVSELMQGRYFRETDVLHVLPDTNKQSVLFDSSLKFITECNLFIDADYEHIVSLTLKLKYELLLPGKKIIEYGDELVCVYFIVSGTVAIYAKSGLELYHQSDGYYFGENGLLPGVHYSEIEVIAIERCSLYVLKRSDFEKIVKNDEKVYDFIRKTINRNQRRQARRITAAVSAISLSPDDSQYSYY